MNNYDYILVNGDVSCDILVTVPGNGMQNAKPLELSLGGTCGNTAVALSRLGLPCLLMGATGLDYYGRFILETLNQEGVDTSAMYISPDQSGSQVIILLDKEGDVLGDFPLGDRIVYEITKNDQKLITHAKWLHTVGCGVITSETRKRMREVIEIAIQSDTTYSLDINLRFHSDMGSPASLEALRFAIQHAYIVLGSVQEFLYLEPDGTFVDAARKLLSDETHIAIIRDGALGAYAVQGDQVIHVPAFKVPVVDTLGAGDVFNAGFLLAFLENKGLEECLRWGNAAAAMQIMRFGEKKGGATRDQLNIFLESQSKQPK